jgi:hypothetical protein
MLFRDLGRLLRLSQRQIGLPRLYTIRTWGVLGRLILVVSLIVLGIGYFAPPAHAAASAASDPFNGAAGSFGEPAAKGTNYNLGDWGVAEQRGAATYTFPIVVPPGRNGMAPDLALRYSSGSSLRGGLAVGWRFDLPSVTRDLSRGYEKGVSPYQASLGGVSGRLVAVPDLAPAGGDPYRVEFDGSFTRFFRRPATVGLSWLALSPDGAKHYFGNVPGAGDHRNRWPITATVDAHGNMIKYVWRQVTSGPFEDYLLEQIEYTSNNAAGLAAHAKVEFGYAPADLCPGSNMPIGAAPSAGAPLGIEGSRRLMSVTSSVRDQPGGAWRVARRVEFGYQLRSSVLHDPTPAPPDGPVCT